MKLNSETSIIDQLNSTPAAEQPGVPSSFGEVWQTSLGQTIENDLSVSFALKEWLDGIYAERNKKIDGLIANGDMPAMYKEMVGDTVSYGEAAWIARDKYGLNIRTDDDVNAIIRDDLKRSKAYADDVFQRAPWYTTPARFGGTIHGYMVDPINMAGMLIGLGPEAKGASYLANAIRAGVKTAAIVGGLETGIQASVYSWKNDVGIDYSVSDALKNIAAATGGAFVFGAGLKTVGQFAERTSAFLKSRRLSRLLAEGDPAAKEAKALLENKLLELQQLDPKTDIAEAIKQVDEYISAQDNAKPVKNADIDTMADATDESIDEAYKAIFNEPEQPVPYVERIETEGTAKQIVTGDASKTIKELEMKLEQINRFNNCLKGV